MSHDLEIAEKLEEIARLVRSNKLLSGTENIEYTPINNGKFIPLVYKITFTVLDDLTKLPITVTIETPVEKK